VRAVESNQSHKGVSNGSNLRRGSFSYKFAGSVVFLISGGSLTAIVLDLSLRILLDWPLSFWVTGLFKFKGVCSHPTPNVS
jgi:hypothetical protein